MICSNATSSVTSYPITLAVYDGPVPPGVTLMLVASAMTWLFVRISPVDEINMPVPAARPCASVVLMLTSAGLTLAAIAFTSSAPVPGLVVPVLPLPKPPPLPPRPLLADGGFELLPAVSNVRVSEFLCSAIATPAPTPADASTSASVARTDRPRRAFAAVGGVRGAGGGATGDQPLTGGAGPQTPP